jgi:hypothetical protein
MPELPVRRSFLTRPHRKRTSPALKKNSHKSWKRRKFGDQIVPIGTSAFLSSKIVRRTTLKVISGVPHGMCSTHKDLINAENTRVSTAQPTSIGVIRDPCTARALCCETSRRCWCPYRPRPTHPESTSRNSRKTRCCSTPKCALSNSIAFHKAGYSGVQVQGSAAARIDGQKLSRKKESQCINSIQFVRYSLHFC